MSITGADLHAILDQYEPALRDHFSTDVDRQLFHVELVSSLAPGGTLVDIGGGLAPLTPAAAVAGMTTILVDDFNDEGNKPRNGSDHLDAHRALGVKIHSRDATADGLGLGPEAADVVITVDYMEHMHHSPKRLFHEIMETLRPGGWLVVGVPNCVHARRRLTVPLGKGKWSQMVDWYEPEVFRGHVREADVDDLEYIARDLGLVEVEIVGKNWLGHKSGRPWVRRLTPYIDRALQRRPSLCSDLYLIGRKP